MAVVKLKLIYADGNLADYERTLLLCAEEEAFQIEDAHGTVRGSRVSAIRSEVNRYAPLLNQLDELAQNAGISLEEVPVDGDLLYDSGLWEPYAEVTARDITGKAERLKQLREGRSSLAETLNENEKVIAQLEHIKELNADLERVFACKFFRFRFGHMPRESYDNLSLNVADADEMFFYPSSIEKREVWGCYFTPITKEKRIDSLFEALNFERVFISERAKGTPAEAIESLAAENVGIKSKIESLSSEIKAFCREIVPELNKMYSVLTTLDRIFEMRKNAVITDDGFSVMGWLEAKKADDFKKRLEQLPSVNCKIENAASLNDGTPPPTKLKNPKFLEGFEDFVKLYGLPSYNELDPTPFVAITYCIFFGMMFGDVGQGAVIILVGALMWFLKKMSLGKVLMSVGVFSIGFGFFYGSVFGMEDVIDGFKPNENISLVLFAAVGIGMLMIIVAQIVNIINGIRQKNPEKVFFSQNGLPGLLLYSGAVVIVLSVLDFIKSDKVPLVPLIIVIAISLLVIFLREPLTKLVEKKKDFIPQNKLDFILENFFELFEVVLSFLTNTISFIRIGAFALSHVGMMSVVFLLAENSTGGHNPVILIIGNLFVIGFEGMIVCIQVLRLEFYELFGRFFDGSGRSFEGSGKLHGNK